MEVHPIVSRIKTASGENVIVSGSIDLPIIFNDECKVIKALYVPEVEKHLVLGCDFWKAFHIRPVICGSIEVQKGTALLEHHDMSAEEALELKKVLNIFPFSREGKLSKTHLITHTIDTQNAQPIKQRNYIISPYMQTEVNKEVDRLLQLDVIEPCDPCAWSNPIVAVKKSSGKIRICLDARKLNNITLKDAYPQPQINRILGRLTGTVVLSSIDFSDAFLQVELNVDSRPKTAFAVSGRGFFRYKRMPFGLCNSAATLCRLVEQVIGCDLEPSVFVYLDDVIIATETMEKHFEVLKVLAERLSRSGLTISVEKSRFCMKRIKFLGYIVGSGGIEPDPEKVSAITTYPTPKNVRDIRRLLGMAGWYHRFIPKFSTIASPLTDMLKKSKSKFVWSDQAEEAFQSLKKILVSQPVLANPDYAKRFFIQSDASDTGVGAVLVQGEMEEERVIAYMSQKLSSAQQKYSTTERECLAVITAIEKFRPYIEGVSFTVITDHASLTWLQNLRDPAGRLGRWALRLQAYDFELKHRKGRMLVVADALSRSVDLVDVEPFTNVEDKWYVNLRKRILDNPQDYSQFQVRNEVVYKFCPAGRNFGYRNVWRMVVPKESRKVVLQQCHDDPCSAHGGFYKTCDRVKRRYYWPKMDEEIRKYVSSCEVCLAIKPTNQIQRAPMGNYREAKRPWQILYIDFVGPFTRSKSGFSYLFVVVDAFSKFVHIHPLRTATSKAVIKFLESRIFLTFSVPEYIVSDNGRQFTSNEFKLFLSKYHVTPWLTSCYHPQANAAEAANKTVETSIRAYIKGEKDHRSWDVNLSEIASAMNSAIHNSTGFSPYFVVFGQPMILSGETYDSNIKDDTVVDPKHFAKVRKIVAGNLKKSYERGRNRYNLRCRPIEYKSGDFVMRKTFRLSDAAKNVSAKLCPKYVKCIVKRKVGTNSYELSDLEGKRLGVFSTAVLKEYTGNNEEILEPP